MATYIRGVGNGCFRVSRPGFKRTPNQAVLTALACLPRQFQVSHPHCHQTLQEERRGKLAAVDLAVQLRRRFGDAHPLQGFGESRIPHPSHRHFRPELSLCPMLEAGRVSRRRQAGFGRCGLNRHISVTINMEKSNTTFRHVTSAPVHIQMPPMWNRQGHVD